MDRRVIEMGWEIGGYCWNLGARREVMKVLIE